MALFFIKILRVLFFGFILFFYFCSACFAEYSFSEKTSYPLTLSNCGRSITFTHEPQSVVTVGQNSTEILYALGLSHKIKATSLWYSPVLKKYTAIDAKIKKLSLNEPSFESILSLRPEMIANHLEWAIGPFGSVANYKQFDFFNIPVYTAPSDCLSKDNSKANDGLRIKPFTLESIYREVEELGKIFNANAEAKALITQLHQQEKEAFSITHSLENKYPKVLFWYSSLKENGDPYVAGSYGVPAYISKKLHLHNIVSSQSEWPKISWEKIVREDPDFIILAEMTRRRYPMDRAAKKLEYLRKNPLTKTMRAVKKNHIIIIDAEVMNPTIRIPEGMKKLSQALLKMDRP